MWNNPRSSSRSCSTLFSIRRSIYSRPPFCSRESPVVLTTFSNFWDSLHHRQRSSVPLTSSISSLSIRLSIHQNNIYPFIFNLIIFLITCQHVFRATQLPTSNFQQCQDRPLDRLLGWLWSPIASFPRPGQIWRLDRQISLPDFRSAAGWPLLVLLYHGWLPCLSRSRRWLHCGTNYRPQAQHPWCSRRQVLVWQVLGSRPSWVRRHSQGSCSVAIQDPAPQTVQAVWVPPDSGGRPGPDSRWINRALRSLKIVGRIFVLQQPTQLCRLITVLPLQPRQYLIAIVALFPQWSCFGCMPLRTLRHHSKGRPRQARLWRQPLRLWWLVWIQLLLRMWFRWRLSRGTTGRSSSRHRCPTMKDPNVMILLS